MAEPTIPPVEQPPVNGTPAKPTVAVTPATPPAPEKGIPEGLQELADKKYGGDINKAWEGNSNAETRMHEATTKVKELERELESKVPEPQPQGQPVQPGGYPNTHPSQWTEVDKDRYYAENHETPEQAWAQYQRTQQAVAPMYEMLAETKLENVKVKMRSEDKFFTPDVEKKFDEEIAKKHPQDRLIPQIQRDCLKIAKGDNMESIVESQVQARLKELQGDPTTPPSVNTPGSGTVPAGKLTISEEKLQSMIKMSDKTPEEMRKLFTEEGV